MRNIKIKDRNSGKTITTIKNNNWEQVINSLSSLNNLEIKYMDLRSINLDETNFKNSDFNYTNFTGSNASEATFINCDFSNADLLDCCLCYSTFINCKFNDTRFGATDISMANFENCVFSGTSSLSLNFGDCKNIKNCTFITEENKSCPFNAPPILITGLTSPIAIMDNHIWTREKTYLLNSNI